MATLNELPELVRGNARLAVHQMQRLGFDFLTTVLAWSAVSRAFAMIGFFYFSTWFGHDYISYVDNE